MKWMRNFIFKETASEEERRVFILNRNRVVLLLTSLISLFFLILAIYNYTVRNIEYNYFIGKWRIDVDATRKNTWYGKAMSKDVFEKLTAKIKNEILEIQAQKIVKEIYDNEGRKQKVFGVVKVLALTHKLLLIQTREVTGTDLQILLWRIAKDQIAISYMLQLPGIELTNAPTFVLKRIN